MIAGPFSDSKVTGKTHFEQQYQHPQYKEQPLGKAYTSGTLPDLPQKLPAPKWCSFSLYRCHEVQVYSLEVPLQPPLSIYRPANTTRQTAYFSTVQVKTSNDLVRVLDRFRRIQKGFSSTDTWEDLADCSTKMNLPIGCLCTRLSANGKGAPRHRKFLAAGVRVGYDHEWNKSFNCKTKQKFTTSGTPEEVLFAT